MITVSENRIGEQTINSVSARDLHKELGLAKSQFNRWIKKNLLENPFFTENIDYIVHRHSVEGLKQNSRGLWINEKGVIVEVEDYILTLDTAKHLAMLSRTEKAHQVRNYFIEVEKKFKSGQTSEKVSLQDIRDRTELLKLSKDQFNVFEEIFYKIGITRKEELAITSNRAVQKETGIDFIELAEKKSISTPDRYFTVTELCQKVMDSDKFSEESKKLVSTKKGDKPRPQNLNKLLETNGFQTKADGIWKPTEKAKDFSDFVQNKSISSEKTVYHLVWKMEILEEIF